ncbi:hypothetical protein BDW74DRAFT_162991 [Aspergillus multicolor]|uniref:uncharacterized protein n=1 Tax=Aspergillus multicolor TaxID=41759 RepID=UPI003CCDF35E
MSFNRFRSAHSKPKPAYEREAHSTRALYKQPSTSTSTYTSSSSRTPTLEEDLIPLTNSMSISRNNSFTMKTLDPRRLSMRLKRSSPSPSTSPSTSPAPYDQYTTHRSNTDPLPLPSTASASGARAEFIYKPINRTDYTAAVAETATAQGRFSPVPTAGSRYTYNHLPSGPASRKHTMGLGIEERTIASQAHSHRQSRSRSRSRAPLYPQTRARSQAHYAPYDEDDSHDSHDLYDDLDEGYGVARRERRDYAPDLYTSAAEKRCHRAARRLTTVMVPDAEDIYG